VLILANTRELIRQIYGVLEVLSKETQIKLILGETGAKLKGGHILITVPGYIEKKLEHKKCDLDLEALKMLVFDEADELLLQDNNASCFEMIK
jgi:superfamily II DNA/RNA helicase